jgi:hypothetical protein
MAKAASESIFLEGKKEDCLNSFSALPKEHMGYDIHITRKAQWADSEGPIISLDEWKALVMQDAEMRLDGFAEATTTQGEKIRIESEGLSVWTAYSGHGYGGNMAWFSYNKTGNITVKNPDKEIRIKIHQIALKLGAIVQGDEDEIYNAKGDAT